METNSMTEIKVKRLMRLKPGLVAIKADPVEEHEGIAVEGLDKKLELPDAAKPVGIKRTGVVVQISEGVERAVIGERVLFSAHAGTTVEVDGEEYEVMDETSILAGIE